jgi:fluoroquinolone transport system permease protein
VSVSVASLFRRLGPVDLRSVRRDPLLAWIGVLPFVLALVYRLVPLLRGVVVRSFGVDLEPWYPLIASTFFTSAPAIVGLVVGFLLIDERDGGVLAAIAVAPVAPATYILYRVAAPIVVATLISVVAYPLSGLVPLPVADTAAAAAVAALLAPAVALFLATFSQNKVSAFAMVKILNTIEIAPVAAWFIPEPAQWLAGVVPSYWAMKMVWQTAKGEPYGPYAAAGIVAGVVVITLLYRAFRRRLYAL